MTSLKIPHLNRIIKLLLVGLILLYSANCQKVDYNAVRVKQVIDGDTIILSNNQHARYLGIDTPETRKNKNGIWVYEPLPFGREALALNRRLVEGKIVRLEFDLEKKDKYNRLLAYCFADGIFVNAKLLEEGLAMLNTRALNVKYVDLLVKAQKQARENKNGFWRDIKIISPEQAGLFLGRFETIEGIVKSTRISDKAVYLNFGRNSKKDFKAMIFKDDLDSFDKDSLLVNNFYKGRRVRITGLVRDYFGPEIIVSHPSQIENLN